MLPYLSLFLAIALASYFTKAPPAFRKFTFSLSLITLLVFVSSRNQVGGDWYNYISMQDAISKLSLTDALGLTDPFYGYIAWQSNKIGFDVGFVNFICAAIFFYGLASFCKRLPNPLFAVCISIPFIITSVAMGYTRQSAALGIVLLAYISYLNFRYINFFGYIFLAANFHASAILCMLPILASDRLKKSHKKIIALAILVCVIAVFAKYSYHLSAIYFSGETTSAGSLPRAILGLLPAVIYLLIRDRWAKRFNEDSGLLDALATASIIFLPFSMYFSTFADRLAIYITPFQVIVYSRLLALTNSRSRFFAHTFFIFLYLLYYILWFMYSPWAQCCWIPYSSFLFHE